MDSYAGTLVCSNDTLLDRAVDPQGKEDLWSQTRNQNTQLQIAAKRSVLYAATWRIQTRSSVDLPQRFCLLPSYAGLCFL